MVHVPRERNSKADLLVKLARIKKPGNNKLVIQETISCPNIDDLKVCMIIEEKSWTTSIKAYVEENFFPEEPDEA